MKVCKEHGHVVLKWQRRKKNQGDVSKYWRGYLKEDDLKIFLDSNGLSGGGILLHTEYNFDDFKCYGHPISGRQEWVEANINGRIVQVQCLIFCEIFDILENSIKTELFHVKKPGTYAIVHFMEYNIFGKFDRKYKLYGHSQKIFFQDEDSFLIRGWSKHTSRMKGHIAVGECPPATIAMIPVECIENPLIAIEDPGSSFPHSWLFVRAKNCWAGGFVARMAQGK